MLAEVLADRGDWSQVMPASGACLFSLGKEPSPPAPSTGASAFRGLVLCCRDGNTDPAGRIGPDGQVPGRCFFSRTPPACPPPRPAPPWRESW